MNDDELYYNRYAKERTGSNYYTEWGIKKEHLQLKNGQIVRKENAKKFVEALIEQEFLDNI